LGLKAEEAVEAAAGSIAAFLGCSPKEIVFTSGATESNNIAILGGAGRAGNVVASASEQPSAAEAVKSFGGRAVIFKAEKDGGIGMGELAEAAKGASLISCMAVNNETGCINDLRSAIRTIKAVNPSAAIHVDGVQAFGKIPISLDGIDFFSFSAHKLHGVKGAGALFVRKGAKLNPIFYGGAQQRGARPGTENPAAAAALAQAAKEAFEDMNGHRDAVRIIRDIAAAGVTAAGGVINSPEDGSPYILNASFPGYMPEALLTALSAEGVFVSAGSACFSKARGKKNRFADVYGWERETAESVLRFSFSWKNTPEEAEYAVKALTKALNALAKKR
jgi:cysteine desulfurase